MAGQQEIRFRTYLQGADPDPIDDAAVEWERCAQLLVVVARSLETAAERDEEIGGRTGPAMGVAFHGASDSMATKARILQSGSEALGRAARVIANAIEARGDLDTKSDLEPRADPGPYLAPVGTPTPDDVRARTEHGGRVAEHQKRFGAREEVSRKWADRMDEVFAREIEVMKNVHGKGRRRTGLHDDPGLPEPPVVIVCPPPPPPVWPPVVVVCPPPLPPVVEPPVVEPPVVDLPVVDPPVDETGHEPGVPQGPGGQVPPGLGTGSVSAPGGPSAPGGISSSALGLGAAGVLGAAGLAAAIRGGVSGAPGTPSAVRHRSAPPPDPSARRVRPEPSDAVPPAEWPPAGEAPPVLVVPPPEASAPRDAGASARKASGRAVTATCSTTAATGSTTTAPRPASSTEVRSLRAPAA